MNSSKPFIQSYLLSFHKSQNMSYSGYIFQLPVPITTHFPFHLGTSPPFHHILLFYFDHYRTVIHFCLTETSTGRHISGLLNIKCYLN